MFENLQSIVDKWQEKYRLEPYPVNYLPSPGHPENAIIDLEKHLSLKFHPTIRSVLAKVNLGSVSFRNTIYGFEDQLTYLREINDGTKYWNKTSNERGYIQFGNTAELFTLEVNNETGVVFARSTILLEQLADHHAYHSPIADNLEEYILIAATIADMEFFETKDEAEIFAEKFFEENNIKHGHYFWRLFIRNLL